jgi:hypothetical protein
MNDLIYTLTRKGIYYQVDQKIRKKLPNFSKNSHKMLPSQKGQNIYSKAQFESPKQLPQTTFKTLKYLQQTMF